jgi:chromosomal replication initiation ATPase DnaA
MSMAAVLKQVAGSRSKLRTTLLELGYTATQAEVEIDRRIAVDYARSHRVDCLRCSGRSPSWPCTDDPEHDWKVKAITAGLGGISSDHYAFTNFKARKGTASALEATQRWVHRDSGWLVLWSERGTGKTHLALALAYERLRQGLPVRYTVTADMLETWKATFSNPDMEFQRSFQSWADHQYLILDDIGMERATPWVQEQLTRLLDYRYVRETPTVITTNETVHDLADRLGPRLADRVFDQYSGTVEIVTLDTTSYRTGEQW